MGCGQSSDGFQVSEEDKRANQRIEEELKRARNEMRSVIHNPSQTTARRGRTLDEKTSDEPSWTEWALMGGL